MARQWTCGFELQTFATGIEVDSNSGTPVISTTTVRSGLASMRVQGTSISKFFTQQFLGTGSTTNKFVRFYFRIASATGTNAVAFALLRDGTSGNGPSLRINTNNTLELWDEQAGVQRGSDSSALSTNTWYRIEFSYIRSTGVITAYIDGVQFATGSSTTNMSMDTFRLGMIDTATCDFFYDDVALNDSSGTNQTGLPGAGNVIRLSPDSAGDVNGFLVQVGGTAGSTNNFTRVNEITPDDATTYNASAVLNAEDLFNCGASGIGATDTVNVVSVGVRFANLVSADATASFKAEIEKTASGTKTQSAAIIPNSTTWRSNVPSTTLPKTYPLTTYIDPDGAAWTQATLDTMQIGYIETVANVQTIGISTIWAYVDYTPAAAITVKPLSALGVG